MKQINVAVIGAGPAGLAAGHELLARGFTTFTIFEATDAVTGEPVHAGWWEPFGGIVSQLLSDPAIERIRDSALREVVITDTIPLPASHQLDKIKVLSVAPLIGEAITRIHQGKSVGALFSSEIQRAQEMLLWDEDDEELYQRFQDIIKRRTAKRLKELEEENRRLKKMYAELSLDHEVLKDLLGVK